MKQCLPYRPCVGIALFNAYGQVFLGERIDTPNAWQMPQGGIDPDEIVEEAALRELEEETGTRNVSILEAAPESLCYDLPQHLLGKLWGGQFCGQEQYWVAARFEGSDEDIDLKFHEWPEFRAWSWTDFPQILDLIVPFKRDVYAQVMTWFEKYSDPKEVRHAEPMDWDQNGPSALDKGSDKHSKKAAARI